MDVVTRRTLPVIDCKEFDPDSMTVDRWVRLMESHFRLHQIIDEGDKLDICRLLCGTKAADTLCGASLLTWDDAKVLLQQEFGERDPAAAAEKQLWQLQRGNKSLTELGREVGLLARRATTDVVAANRHAIEVFLRLAGQEIANDVKKLGYTTLREVIDAACRCEEVLKEMKLNPAKPDTYSKLQVELSALREELN